MWLREESAAGIKLEDEVRDEVSQNEPREYEQVVGRHWSAPAGAPASSSARRPAPKMDRNALLSRSIERMRPRA